MPDKKSALSGIGMMATLTISSKLVRLVILMITARFLTPEDFGVVAAFTMVFGFAYLIADMGMVRALIQRPVISEKHIGSALTLSVSLCLIVFVTLYSTSSLIASMLTIEEISLPLKVASFIFLLLGVSNTCSALFQRNGQVVFIGKVQAFGTIIGSLLVTVPLLYFDIGYWAIIIGLLASEVISILFILFKGIRLLHFKAFKVEIQEIVKYGIAFFFNSTLGMISQQVDIAVISRYMGGATLGNYSRAMQLVEFPNQVYWLVVDRVVFPVMSAMKNEKEKLSAFFLQSFSLLSLALMIGSTILIFGSHEIVLIMMGDQWGNVAELLQILATCIIFRALASFMDSFLAAYDLVKFLTAKQITSLVLLVISIWIGLDYGIIGIACAIVVSSFLRFSLTIGLIVIKTRITFFDLLKGFAPTFISALLIITLYYIFYESFAFRGLWSILFCVVIFVIGCIVKPSSLFLSGKGCSFLLEKRARFIK
jgi:O-antigen/teichoic acid export membrane protein